MTSHSDILAQPAMETAAKKFQVLCVARRY
jgi:hypothetical protein